MKKSTLFLIAGAILATVWAAGTLAAESQTWNGEYRWNNGAQGPLKAVFKPTGKNSWKVAFHFRFQDRKHVYRGTAEGSLGDGPLKGMVKNGSKKRTFTFEGKVKKGKFLGSHAEAHSGSSRNTGTLFLSLR